MSHSRPSLSCILGGQGPSPFGVPPGGDQGGATFLILMGVALGSRVLRNSLGEVGEVQPPSSREAVEVAVVVAAVIFWEASQICRHISDTLPEIYPLSIASFP